MSIVASPDGPLGCIDETPSGKALVFARPFPSGSVVTVYDMPFSGQDGPEYLIEILWCGVPLNSGGVVIYRRPGEQMAYRCPVLYYNPDSRASRGLND